MDNKMDRKLNMDELEQVTGGVQGDENVRLPAFSSSASLRCALFGFASRHIILSR